jgi:exodeoxyribonuclease VII small subunit
MSDGMDNLSFEEALLELEQTVAQLESGNLTLDASLALFERGQRLATYCGQLLDRAQLRIEQLTEDGEIVSLTLAD